jgi:hypothetical protein
VEAQFKVEVLNRRADAVFLVPSGDYHREQLEWGRRHERGRINHEIHEIHEKVGQKERQTTEGSSSRVWESPGEA